MVNKDASWSHPFDHGRSECGALHFLRAFHLAGEVVCDHLVSNRLVQRLDDQVGGFRPAHVTQHHLTGQDDATGVDDVFAGVLRRGAVRGFEDGVAGDVVDVAAGGDADAADLRGQRVAEVIAIQIERGDDVELGGARQHLLQGDVGNGVFDDDAVGQFAPRAAVNLDSAEFALREGVAPIAEGAFGELHDVAFVDNRDRLAVVVDGVLDRGADEAFGAFRRDRLDADAAGQREPDFLHAHFVLEERDEFLRFGRTGFPFDTGVDVLGVLAEDDHVHLLGMFDGRGDALEPHHRPQAHIQVEHLAERDVERADAFAHRSGQRAFDADEVILERLDGFVREPVVEFLERLLTGPDFEPFDLALTGIRFLDGGVEHADAGGPDVRAGAVATDERKGWVIWN